MPLFDLISLAFRNLREAKLRAALTTTGVVVGVAVVVTMLSLGLGLQRNAVEQFQDLNSFSEVHVFGRSMFSLALPEKDKGADGQGKPSGQTVGGIPVEKIPVRSLGDDMLEEIKKIPGVVYVKPNIFFTVFLRSNGRTMMKTVGGASVPDPAARFKEFAAGGMLSDAAAEEVLVDEDFVRDFGYGTPSVAVGRTLELLDPPAGAEGVARPDDVRVARTYRIVGVLKDERDGNRLRGLLPNANIYLPLQAARGWKDEHLDSLSRVALQLARKSGSVAPGEKFSYTTAVVRVSDPSALTGVRNRLTELGLGSFSFADEFKQMRTIFLIINSSLGLIGAVSLLIASLGIANTMLMSILERTREIGIMKAIGAEDREIKLIFFAEALMIGLAGGVLGALAAWGIDAAANRLAFSFVLKPQGARYVEFFSLPPALWLGAILVAVLVSIGATVYPASRAARVDPVAALRHD
jgi:ABC-type antimicrobial peptide transport system permease subunit